MTAPFGSDHDPLEPTERRGPRRPEKGRPARRDDRDARGRRDTPGAAGDDGSAPSFVPPSVRGSIELASHGAGQEGGGPASSQRVAQVSSLIARVLRERLLRGLNDPRVQGMVSILEVQCTPDFAAATVHVSVLPADRARLALSGLRSATRHLEGVVRKATRLRKVPRLLFELDDSIKREAAIAQSLQAIREANEDAGRPPPDPLPERQAEADADQDRDQGPARGPAADQASDP